MKKYLELIRIKHWIKNILIFLPMLCAKQFSLNNLYYIFIGFISFCFTASFVYIINDIKDIEVDKLHPRKKLRPIPSGAISKKKALIISFIMLLMSLALLLYKNNENSVYFLLAYIVINFLYSFGLKNVTIIDIILLTSCFVIRVYFGASLLNIEVSDWLFLTIISASLFLGFGKRKKELINSNESRKVLKKYNKDFLDKFQYICLCLVFIFYSLWAKEQDSKYMIFTVPILMTIFMRYSLISESNSEGDPTTLLYSDKALFFLCFLYGIVMVAVFMVL